MNDTDVRVLVPIAVLEGETIPEPVVRILSQMDVILLGYHVLPEQTATEQAQEQFHEKVHNELADYEALFSEHGGSARSRIVFTHNKKATFDRIAVEEEVDTILLLNAAPAINRILVPIRGGVNLDRITRIAAAISPSEEGEIVLYHAASSDDERPAAETLFEDATNALVTAGFPAEKISTEFAVVSDPITGIKAAADAADFVIMGEKEPSVIERILGEAANQVADSSLSPVLVVRKNSNSS
ncbi:universal stress protein [Natronocalculus amylovorans]|uniref:Universal stress protein n=1 Tax=Natronocalculus amylovorans TaxID=2917812 RepID=A0AAE3K9G7_9EURY|nr:universal stress protein [Natronocalculus amylovorans]MCL9818023.1 universal stress protein [Natronocalculus amylovorans]NUE03986.1 universal stress protein [Halorubraceae archaeon YAN]